MPVGQCAMSEVMDRQNKVACGGANFLLGNSADNS